MIHLEKQGKAKCGSTPWRGSFNFMLSKKESEVTCKRCLGKVKRSVSWAPIKENMIGKILHCSWGYSMTINEYVKVIKQTEKSLIVQECYAEVKDDNGMGSGRASTNGQIMKDAQPFSIKLRERVDYQGQTHRSLIGNMPGNSSAGYWQEWDGKESYHNTWD